MPAPSKLLIVVLATVLVLVASSAVTTAQMNTTTVPIDQCILCKSGDCAKSNIKYCSDYSSAGGMSSPCCCAKSEICGTGPAWCNCAPGLLENQYAWAFFAIGAVVIVALLAFATYASVVKRRSQLPVVQKSQDVAAE